MNDTELQGFRTLKGPRPIWHRFFQVAPLFLVGTREEDGGYNLSPVHHVMPMGWSSNHLAMVTAPSHRTYVNLERTGSFTLSSPRPDQILEISLAAAPRTEDGAKPGLDALEVVPARAVDGVLVKGAELHLECSVQELREGYGENVLVVGLIRAAHVAQDVLRHADRDDGDLIHQAPRLVYLSPGRWGRIEESWAFPFPAGFRR